MILPGVSASSMVDRRTFGGTDGHYGVIIFVKRIIGEGEVLRNEIMGGVVAFG
ncbi:MAG: hypothetical protein R2822_07780 [Spirosomataceae bacterium]